MRPPRTSSIAVSVLLFAIIGLVMHELVGPNLCAHQLRVGAASVVVLLLLVTSLSFCKDDKSDARSIRRVCSYTLVIALSAGLWYEIWSIQACNAGPRTDVIHQSQ